MQVWLLNSISRLIDRSQSIKSGLDPSFHAAGKLSTLHMRVKFFFLLSAHAWAENGQIKSGRWLVSQDVHRGKRGLKLETQWSRSIN